MGNDYLTSIDGTNFEVLLGFDKAFYGHKFKGWGLWYEVTLSILKGNIVWINGPYECGLWPNISIFHDALISELDKGKKVEADDGYVREAPSHVKCPSSFMNDEQKKKEQARVRSCHKTVNQQFKQWGCLWQKFWHLLDKHSMVFWAVAIIMQLAIQLGEPLFNVKYDDDEVSLWNKIARFPLVTYIDIVHYTCNIARVIIRAAFCELKYYFFCTDGSILPINELLQY